MKVKSCKIFAMLLLGLAVLLAGCGREKQAAAVDAKWESCKNLYETVVQYSGENESTQKYLEIAERSQRLFPLLEEHVGAFVMNAYNYQDIDGKGTPLYTQNGLHSPVEIDPYGHTICVSKNYFKFNPIETATGAPVAEEIVVRDDTLNILVPEMYRDREAEVLKAHREAFYFEKVQATNDYNRDAGIDETLDLDEEDLAVNVIYVKDGQRYFTYRSDCAADTDNWITDPIVRIYTSNTHCNYAHSYMSQWVYFPSDAGSAEAAYKQIEPYVEQCGARDSFQQVRSVYEENAG